jgi:hypothetical protein
MNCVERGSKGYKVLLRTSKRMVFLGYSFLSVGYGRIEGICHVLYALSLPILRPEPVAIGSLAFQNCLTRWS